MNEQTPYDRLSPELILDAVESIGLMADGRLLALNSYENRVYQVGIEDAKPVVAKFYRPHRWSDAAIGEEHAFALKLADNDIPVVPPTVINGNTLHVHEGYRFALFRRQGGRDPSLESEENLTWFGRLLGRIHAVGASQPFRERQRLMDVERVSAAVAHVSASEFMPMELKGRYDDVCRQLLLRITERYAEAAVITTLSIHGDCHRGNVLWTDDGPHFVDLDDCCTGPAIQDIWMLLDGDREAQRLQLDWLLEGYEQFMEFDYRELAVVEALRASRMIEYAAWIARRWADPAFPRHFSWFAQPRWWEDHIAGLTEQIQRMDQPLLAANGNA
jgi:Ser/Thr protein kinase RdoA (MazF antagonist)